MAPDSTHIHTSVDELYRMSLGYESPATWRDVDLRRGWSPDTNRNVERQKVSARTGGKRGVFVRVPDRKLTVIILTNDDSADANGMANRILERLRSAQ